MSPEREPTVVEPELLRFCKPERTQGGTSQDSALVLGGPPGNFRPPALPTNVTTLDDGPPALSGGTLLATRDGQWLVASDPDRDQLYVISVERRALEQTRTLAIGAEPGRLIEDGQGRIHVVLRGGKSIVSTELREPRLVERPVCDLPRGIAYDAARDLLHVACAEGKLVTLGADPDSGVQRVLELGRDLRDVVVHDGKLFVSRFRAAELLELNGEGAVVGLSKPPRFVSDEAPSGPVREAEADCLQPPEQRVSHGNSYSPNVAWRTIDLPGVGVAMLHQQASEAVFRTTSGAYAGGNLVCSQAPVRSALTLLAGPAGYGGPLQVALLAVDVAVSPGGAKFAVASPGGFWIGLHGMLFNNPMIGATGDGSCVGNTADLLPKDSVRSELGPVTAAAFASDDVLVLQAREPAEIVFLNAADGSVTARLNLEQPSRFDFGHTVFHSVTQAGLACASCHPEGMDDGHTWEFDGIGLRRTQSLRGGILGSEPFHWNGDIPDFEHLVDDVYSGRMNGFQMEPAEKLALASWIDRLPALRASARDAVAAQRGRELFQSRELGCAGCHSGTSFTNNETHDVGTGAALQVPSLQNVSFRTPLLHDGCAQTLRDRFGPCGGGDSHGHTSQLSTAQLADLIAYLETL